ncbi:MAG: hypothetical protein VYA27_03505, partial [Verrucomicrobiota bacterium]|nr:hypothetical protein [Verrucomicrobiota bacterium]
MKFCLFPCLVCLGLAFVLCRTQFLHFLNGGLGFGPVFTQGQVIALQAASQGSAPAFSSRETAPGPGGGGHRGACWCGDP